MPKRSTKVLLLGAGVLCLLVWFGRAPLGRLLYGGLAMMRQSASVADRQREHGEAVRQRLAPAVTALGLDYPPARLALLAFKDERRLELWVAGPAGPFQHLKDYAILGASGRLGPKLREGDRQVPEGLYQVASLNPNSRFHLSLRLNYPNDFDQAQARLEGRQNLGSDIMIHGRSASIGCLAMGDPAIEGLFILAAATDLAAITVLIAPVDFRTRELPPDLADLPPWAPTLYEQLRAALAAYQRE